MYDEEDTKKLALNEFSEYRELNVPFHTDKNGWDKMIDQIEKTNSKNATLKQLKNIGINTNKYEYHFTSDYKIKGSYIEKFIDIMQFNNVFFVDDMKLQQKL